MIDFNLIPLLPELFLLFTAMGLLIVGVNGGNRTTDVISVASIIGLALAMFLLFGIGWERTVVLNGMFVMDGFAGFMKLLILFGLMAAIGLSISYLYQEHMVRFEYPVLVLLAGIGMMLMVSAHNLLGLYMALELQSLSLYVLAAFRRNSYKSAEAGAKYFILGALSSGMILFGISLIYGFTGSIDFSVINAVLSLSDTTNLGALIGLVFLLCGLAFKISAVPFHMWTPDVYQGAPTSVTALFAMVPKIAAMALLIRILFEPFSAMITDWSQIIIFLSAASMTIGAFAALVQENIKRLMAYSSIGNMGYALIGLAAATQTGVSSVILYLLIYLFMTAGVFAVIMCLRRGNIPVEKISDMGGLSQTNPGLAYGMAILMFSMSGIPPLAGFFGKLFVFQAAIEAELYALAIFGVITSVIAAYYYLRIIKVMFFDEPVDAIDKGLAFSKRIILFVSILFVLGFAIKPNIFVSSTQTAAEALFIQN
ncbi:MAG: NADH-quinone oxidoreductase subunit NuoN [Alphaproteobacteria bacterium]